MATIHASAALIGEVGVLIRGDSGSGKSSLLLDILAADPRGTRLVADDRVILTAANGRILADVPAAIAGLLEIRGVGVVQWPYAAPVVVRLVVDLKPAEACPRLPEADEAAFELDGAAVPRLALPVGAAANRERVVAAVGGIAAGLGVRPIASCVAESNGQDVGAGAVSPSEQQGRVRRRLADRGGSHPR